MNDTINERVRFLEMKIETMTKEHNQDVLAHYQKGYRDGYEAGCKIMYQRMYDAFTKALDDAKRGFDDEQSD